MAGNVLTSSIFQQLIKVIGSRKSSAAADDYSLRELSAAFPAPPVALPIVTQAITTHLQARGREAY